MIPRRWLTQICTVGSLAGLVACGGSPASRHTTRFAYPARPASADTVRTADCAAWNAADAGERRRLVAGLRSFFSQRLDTGARERVLPDDRAYKIITGYCRLPFARAFLIYRLYGNATAFSGQR